MPRRILALAALLAASASPALAQTPPLQLSLTQAIGTAERNNLDLRGAAQDVEVARNKVVSAGAALLPTLDARSTYQRAQSAVSFPLFVPDGHGGFASQNVSLSTQDTTTVGATLSYALYTGGAARAGVGQAAAGLSAAEAQYAATRATVDRDVATAYFALVQARQLADIADRAVEVAREDVSSAEKLFAAGTVAKADVLRQRVSLANAQADAVGAHNGVDLSNAALANVLGAAHGARVEPTESLETSVTFPALDEGVRLAMRRPELAAGAAAVTLAEHAISGARAGGLPTIGVGFQEVTTKPASFGLPQPQFGASLQATWRLFDGGATRGNVRAAQAQLERAKTDLARLGNAIDLEVRQTYFNLTAARATLEAARVAQTSAQENLRLGRVRYAAGVGTSLELSDALLAATQADNRVVTSLASLRSNDAAYKRAIGGSP